LFLLRDLVQEYYNLQAMAASKTLIAATLTLGYLASDVAAFTPAPVNVQ